MGVPATRNAIQGVNICCCFSAVCRRTFLDCCTFLVAADPVGDNLSAVEGETEGIESRCISKTLVASNSTILAVIQIQNNDGELD